MIEIKYLDNHGVLALVQSSLSSIHRWSKRKVDPFPSGKMIGGKRYREQTECLEWLARQDDPVPTPAGARDDAPMSNAKSATPGKAVSRETVSAAA